MPAGWGRPIPTSPNGKKRGSCSPSSISDGFLPRFRYPGKAILRFFRSLVSDGYGFSYGYPEGDVRCFVFANLRSGERPGAVLQCLPEPSLVGPLVALEHGLGRLPAAELAEHLQRLIHQVRGMINQYIATYYGPNKRFPYHSGGTARGCRGWVLLTTRCGIVRLSCRRGRISPCHADSCLPNCAQEGLPRSI